MEGNAFIVTQIGTKWLTETQAENKQEATECKELKFVKHSTTRSNGAEYNSNCVLRVSKLDKLLRIRNDNLSPGFNTYVAS